MGEDLDCISKIIFPGEEEEEITVDAMSFMRKSSGHLKVRVPVGIRGGMSSIRLIASNGSELQSNAINLLAAAKDPDGSVKCYIKHIGSDRYLTRNTAEEYPRVMSYTGSRDQEFTFVPVDEIPGNYYLKNSATGEFLVIGDENDWRMIWVFDPTTISIPERGMYQVINIKDSDNIQIKNVGSGVLGTDSNDENSEVYGNKSGQSKPRFLWKLDNISGSFDVPESSLVIWEGEQDFGEWYDFYLEADQFKDLTVGSVINITIQASDAGWSNFDLSDVDWDFRSAVNHTELCGTGLWDYKGETMPVNAAIEVPYDYKVVNAFKEGFRLDGPGAWVTMVTYGDQTSSVGVEVVEASDEAAVVYNLQGVCVRKAATIADALETLPKGLYIVNGKKIIK